MARVAVVAFAVATGGLGAPAAAGEGESALGVAATYDDVALPELVSAKGGGLVLDYQRGLTAAMSLRVALHGAALRSAGDNSYVGAADVGLVYAVDILKYVPYLDVGVGGLVVGGGALERTFQPLVEVGAGLDVLTSRTFSYGPFLRVTGLVGDASLLTVGLRAAYRWGYF